MCRLVFYRGAPIRISSLLTEPDHSIIHQSYRAREREEPLNGDGFGVGWYTPQEPDRPAVFKSISPAWNNHNLANLAPAIHSPCIVAHVRAATPGLPVTQLNCHPFSWHRFMFAHNGIIGGFRSIKRRLQSELSDEAFAQLQGSTDSEHLFVLLADEYRELESDDRLDKMATAMERAIERVNKLKKDAGIDEPSMLNLVLTDGNHTVISRYASKGDFSESLYLNTGAGYECVDGVCRMDGSADRKDAVLVASEPLSNDTGWRPVARNTMLLIDADLDIVERQMAIDG